MARRIRSNPHGPYRARVVLGPCPRRLACLVLSAIALAMLPLAGAAGETADGDAEGTARAWGSATGFTVPERLVGDTGTYREVSSADETVEVRFRLLPREAVRMGDGAYMEAVVFETERVRAEEDASADAPASPSRAVPQRVALDGTPLTFGMLGATATSSSATGVATSVAAWHRFGDTGVLCGMVSSVQGGAVDGPDIRVGGACGVDAQVLGTTDGDGTPAMVATGHDPRGTWTFWWMAGIPYPVRVELEADKGTTEWTLAGFARGTERETGVELPAGEELPDVSTAPAHAWGPDTSGAFQAYPLENAVQDFHDDPLDPRLRDYLAANPEAYLLQAMSLRHPASETPGWTLTFSAPSHSLHAMTWAAATPQGVPPLPGMLVPERRAFVVPEAAGPPREELPTHLPRLAEVQEAWATYAGSDLPPLHWGFTLASECQETCQGRVYAGDVTEGLASASAGLPCVPDCTEPGPGVNLHVGGDGSVWGIYVSHRTTPWQDAVPLEPPGPEAPMAQAAPVQPWSWGVPQVAAGLTLLGVIAGGLYWVWPALQSGVGAFFTRVRHDEVLDHPVRRRIHDAVKARPGIHYQQLLREQNLAKGTLEHHLRKLVEGGLVSKVPAQGRSCYFVRGAGDWRVLCALGTASSPGMRSVLQAVQQTPGINGTQAAAAAGLSKATVTVHVKTLQEAGLVHVRRSRRGTLELRPTPLAAQVTDAARHAPSPSRSVFRRRTLRSAS